MKLILTALIGAFAGGLIGAAAYALVLENERAPGRGSLLRLGDIEGYHEIDTTPYCIELQHFCLIRLESGEVRALYTYDTHPIFRAQSCAIRWRPDFSFRDPATGENSVGWFRGDCSGTTYRYSGERVFGPGPRDMDRFAVEEMSSLEETPDGDELRIEYLEVDTRHLICGEVINSTAPEGCDWAPLPQ